MLVTSNECIQVLLCGKTVVRQGIKTILRKQKNPSATIVAESDSLQQLHGFIKKFKPCIAIVELRHAEILSFIRQCNEQPCSKVPIIVLTENNERHTALALIHIGIKGILHHTCDEATIAHAVYMVHSGQHYYCPGTTMQLFGFLSKEKKHNPGNIVISEIEKNIIRLICEQKSTKEISAILGLAKRTVDDYRRKIANKVGAINGVGIALWAVKNGLFQL